MISIRQCVSEEKIQKLKNQHNTFIFKEIEKRVDFYIHLFQVLKEINGKKRITGKQIENKIKFPKILHFTQYESYINTIYKKPHNFSKDKYVKLKHDDKFKIKKKDFDNIIGSLNHLKSSRFYKYNLLQLDLSQRKTGYFLYYKHLVKQYEPIKFLQNKIFDYAWFVALSPDEDWSAYKLTSELGINVCCYCNKQYVFSLTNDSSKVTRPQLDHFLPQKDHPLLGLNFFNLIPSCKVCNVDCKNQADFSYEKNISPYEKISSSELFTYDYEPKSYLGATGQTRDIEIEIRSNIKNDNDLQNRMDNNLKIFEEKLLINQHKDIAQEIIKKRHMSNDKYLDILSKTFPKAKLTLKEAYQLAYGNFYDENLFHKRPLAKFTKDISLNTGSLKLKKI